MSSITAPDFTLPATSEKQINLKDYAGKSIVLYFYPKDRTPGCTIESKAFRDHYDDFQKLNTEIFGVSRDTLTSHEKFKSKHNMPFELISDAEEKLCKHFDVISENKFLGKVFHSIIRSTFLIDPSGKVINEWRKVKVRGHVKDVLNTLNENLIKEARRQSILTSKMDQDDADVWHDNQ